MFGFIVGFVVGLVVGWGLPQPVWAESFINWIKEKLSTIFK